MTDRKITDRPIWCPHVECKTLRCLQQMMCVGLMPEPVAHGADYNTHRLCLVEEEATSVLDERIFNQILDLQINKSDVFWFRTLFDVLVTAFPCAGCGVVPGYAVEKVGYETVHVLMCEKCKVNSNSTVSKEHVVAVWNDFQRDITSGRYPEMIENVIDELKDGPIGNTL